MKPYYERDGITIYLGDCLEIVPTLRPIDVLVMDPPFYLPAHVSTSRRSWPRTLSEVAVMEGYFRDVFATLVGHTKTTGALYTFSDGTSHAVFTSLLYPLFDRTQTIVWDKGIGGMGNGWRHSNELIIHGAFAKTAYAPGFRRDVLACPTTPSDARSHASEKPVGLLAHLLRAHPPSGVTLDPFMGTGATLQAAKQLGQAAIGIEIEERYCEIAAKRLAQDVLFGNDAA